MAGRSGWILILILRMGDGVELGSKVKEKPRSLVMVIGGARGMGSGSDFGGEGEAAP